VTNILLTRNNTTGK